MHVLGTKLHAPSLRPAALSRPRLLQRLGRDAIPRLVLVSAPPGFGKTTVVLQWLASLERSPAVAWVSLDAGDSDPAGFWTYVVAALEQAVPGVGARARAQLAGDGSATSAAISLLLDDLAAAGRDRDVLLVLDDLHAVESRRVDEELAFMLAHLPPRAHLVILTRADPGLPLARWRARGELAELRAADLRFTPDEASEFLNEAMRLGLAAPDVATLEARTEGWIAALQLAAISLRDREDRASFVAQFAGDDRHIVDYLADEVLERQPAAVRDFLLATSVLDRLTGGLCDALTGRTDGATVLESLERANLFLVPLDDRRRWYRYHHLFADLLRARLLAQRPADVAGLHGRASRWWETNGEPAEAIRHALAAGDAERAADLIEVAAHDLRRTRQEATLRQWLDTLPERVFDVRPVLAVAHAGVLLQTGEAGRVEERLRVAERWLGAAGGAADRTAAEALGLVVRHPTALAHLGSAIALYRAALARMRGDGAATVAQARLAYAAAHEDQPLERGAAAGILGLAAWTAGDLEAAHETWAGAIGDLERAGHRSDMLGGLLAMADIRLDQGRLMDARRTLERGLALGVAATPPLRGTADMHVGLANLALERADLAAAGEHLVAADALGPGLGLPQNAHRSLVVRAGLRAAEGNLPAARRLLDEAERVFAPDFFPVVRPIPALRTRLWIREGRPAEALAWARDRGLATTDELSYLAETEHVTFAMTLVVAAAAEGGDRRGLPDALAFVDRLVDVATRGSRGRVLIELDAARAVALAAAGDRTAASAALGRALKSASSEGFVRPFMDLGTWLRPLLLGIAGADAARVVAALGPGPGVVDAGSAVRRPAAGRLPEPLSERELDVLRLLASDLDGPAIAAQLFVSLNTLRTHTKNIFAKLGVNSRRAAVTRARELRLIPGAG